MREGGCGCGTYPCPSPPPPPSPGSPACSTGPSPQLASPAAAATCPRPLLRGVARRGGGFRCSPAAASPVPVRSVRAPVPLRLVRRRPPRAAGHAARGAVGVGISTIGAGSGEGRGPQDGISTLASESARSGQAVGQGGARLRGRHRCCLDAGRYLAYQEKRCYFGFDCNRAEDYEEKVESRKYRGRYSMREEQVTRVEKLSIHSHFVDIRTVTVITNHVLGMAQEREALIRRLGFSDNSWMQMQ